MEHSHLDAYARLNSPVHRTDPRVKIAALLIYLVIYVYLRQFATMALGLAPVIILLAVSKLPWGHIFSRLLWLLPFGGVMALSFPFLYRGEALWTWQVWGWTVHFSEEGLGLALLLVLRLAGALAVMVLLTSTTPFRDLLKGLADMKIPGIFIQLTEFTVRYIFVFVDEYQRMKRARKARAGKSGGSVWNRRFLKGLGETVGVLFLRAYERGEKVYQAMLARAFQGDIKTISHYHLHYRDFLVSAGLILWVLLLKYIEWGA